MSTPIQSYIPAPCRSCSPGRLRIAHITEAPLGGVLAYMQEVIEAQVRSPEVEAVYALVPEVNAKSLLDLGKVIVLPFQHKRGSLSGLVCLAIEAIKLVRKAQPDIVHIHSTIAGGIVRISAPKLRPKPKIVYCPHGWAFSYMASRQARWLIAFVERLLASRTDSILCVSESERQQAINAGIPPSKCMTIQNGIAATAILPNCQEMQPRTGKLKILFVGRFDREKGIDIFLDVLRLLEGWAEGIVAGAYIVNKAKALPAPSNVTYLGWRRREEVLQLYRQADVLLMPSRAEGLPIAALEAMRAGLPVFASRVGGLPELVVDGVTGRLFDADRPEEIACVLRSITRDQLVGYGERGHARFLEHFTAARMNRELLAHYRKLISGPSRRETRMQIGPWASAQATVISSAEQQSNQSKAYQDQELHYD